MAIDTVQKRASSIGQYWPAGAVDRIMALEEYGGIGVGVAVTPEPVGVPELIRLTMRTPGTLYAGRHAPSQQAGRQTDKGYTIRRR